MLLSFNSVAATLTSPGLVCLGERTTFNCTVMGTAMAWRYNGMQVGPAFQLTSTPATEIDTVDGIMFTVAHISNDNNMLVSSLCFIADMATNGQITCLGGGNRQEKIIQLGSGKDYQPCTCTCTCF